MTDKILEIKNLNIYFPETDFTAVKDSSFDIKAGEIMALV